MFSINRQLIPYTLESEQTYFNFPLFM